MNEVIRRDMWETRVVDREEDLPGKFRRLSNQELQQHRAQGLCYRCDEKYSLSHRCKKEPSVLVVQEADEYNVDEDTEMGEMTELAGIDMGKEMEVSLNSIVEV